MSPTWDLLITSIGHRSERLETLLGSLAPQITAGVGVRVFRDNLEFGYGAKCSALVQSSEAEYVSFIDDDDTVPGNFVAHIQSALESRPDYVGFRVLWLQNGSPQRPVYHSIKYNGWIDEPEALYRHVVHFNPIRRELALLGEWAGGNGADRRWAAGVWATGRVQREVFLDEALYVYQESTSDTFQSPREPLAAMPDFPTHAFPFVDWL